MMYIWAVHNGTATGDFWCTMIAACLVNIFWAVRKGTAYSHTLRNGKACWYTPNWCVAKINLTFQGDGVNWWSNTKFHCRSLVEHTPTVWTTYTLSCRWMIDAQPKTIGVSKILSSKIEAAPNFTVARSLSTTLPFGKYTPSVLDWRSTHNRRRSA